MRNAGKTTKLRKKKI